MGSMALQLKSFPVPGPLETYGRAMSLRALMDERRYRALREQQAQQKILEDQEERQQARNLSQLFSTNPNPTMQQNMPVAPGRVALRAATELRQAQPAEETAKTAALTRQKTFRDVQQGFREEYLNAVTAIARDKDPARRAAIYPQIQQRLRQAAGEYLTPELDAFISQDLPDDEDEILTVYAAVKGPEALEKLLKDRATETRAKAEAERQAAEEERKEPAETRAATTAGLETEGKELDLGVKTAPLVTDQATYTAWRGKLPQRVQAQISETYSPDAVAIVERMGLTAQQRQPDALDTPDKVITWMEQPGRTPEEIKQGKRTLDQMIRYRQATRPPNITATTAPGLVDAVIQNPNLWDSLTPTARTEIAPEVARRGGAAIFGKPLSESAITKLADSRSAIASLRDLRAVLTANEQYIGPLAGFQAVNPYSEGRKAQADIDRVKQRVGKTLEGGVLRKEDEEKYKKILATLSDTPATAIYKVDQLIEDVTRDMDLFMDEQKKAGRRVESRVTPPPTGGVTVKAPNGKTYRFPNQAEADAFKKRAGIR